MSNLARPTLNPQLLLCGVGNMAHMARGRAQVLPWLCLFALLFSASFVLPFRPALDRPAGAAGAAGAGAGAAALAAVTVPMPAQAVEGVSNFELIYGGVALFGLIIIVLLDYFGKK